MIQPKQRGKKTYVYDMVEWVFNESLLEETFERISTMLIGKYKISTKDIHTKIEKFSWTQLGPSGRLEISIYDTKHIITIGCFRDGWHIKLSDSRFGSSSETNEKVFGNPNQDRVWTQETEKVPKIIAEIYKAVKEI